MAIIWRRAHHVSVTVSWPISGEIIRDVAKTTWQDRGWWRRTATLARQNRELFAEEWGRKGLALRSRFPSQAARPDDLYSKLGEDTAKDLIRSLSEFVALLFRMATWQKRDAASSVFRGSDSRRGPVLALSRRLILGAVIG